MKSIVALAVLTAGAFFMPAHATPQLRNLLAAVQATGTRVVFDHPSICRDPEIYGMYTYRPGTIDRLTVCIDNHRGDSAELRNTVLHEAVHVAQTCKGGVLFTVGSIRGAAYPEELSHVGKYYTSSQFDSELEARVIAREQDEVFVTKLIKDSCK